VVSNSAFFLTIDKEIGEQGVGYAKLKRVGFQDSKSPAKAQPTVFW
jgi:hypothetical protein